MLLAPSVCGLFKWRQFEPEVILLAVGWYLRFSLSYRDLEELLAERGLHADHVTVWRWVQRYAPEMERRLRRRLEPTNDSWRVDETYIRVKGKWVYLYRALDSTGATIDFLPSAKRDTVAAKRFLTKALDGKNHPAPRVINTDKDAAYPPAIVQLKAEAAGVLGTMERRVRLSHRHRLLRRHAGYSWSTAGLRKGRSSPRATASGIAKEYRPSMLMCSWTSGESLATSASPTG
jgi:transposase-like protein